MKTFAFDPLSMITGFLIGVFGIVVTLILAAHSVGLHWSLTNVTP